MYTVTFECMSGEDDGGGDGGCGVKSWKKMSFQNQVKIYW